jgi:ubiquinone/menaquinone biosynthesis C-methylase UbiE
LQGILTLDVSRELRFRDDRKDLILYILGLRKGMKILEVGCGTGALARKLALWLGNDTTIVGLDRDTNFINYARSKAMEKGLTNMSFVEGDALQLPFEDNSFDACFSFNVIELVPNREFLLEQKRICKDGGKVSVMATITNKEIASVPNEAPKQTEREKELMKPFELFFEKIVNEHLENHWIGYDGLPRLYDELGFRDVQVDAIALPVVADDSRNSIKTKRLIIENDYKIPYLETVEMRQGAIESKLSESDIAELKMLIENRFTERWNYIEKGIKLWDYRISIVLIVSGTK